MEPSGNTLPKTGGAGWLDVGKPANSVVARPITARPITLAVTVTLVILFAGTIALWTHYGAAVFYEMIVAGLASCF
jgi:hypothetical protein